jgi:hypothetical protein
MDPKGAQSALDFPMDPKGARSAIDLPILQESSE